MRILHSCCIVLAVWLMSSCAKEDIALPSEQHGSVISFSMKAQTLSRGVGAAGYGVLTQNMVLRSGTSPDTLAMGLYVHEGMDAQCSPQSRGVVLTENNLTSFGVWASREEDNVKESFFKNLKVTRNASTGECASERAYYWPGAMYTLGFVGIAPYNPQGLTVDDNGALPATLDYTVPTLAVDQSDLMIGVTHDYNGDDKTPVHLEFRHLCSAVNVKVGTIPQGSIEAITFKNIFNKGSYTLASNTWSVTQGSKADFAVDFVGTSTNYPTAGIETGNPQINDASATFMMIPQTLPDDAEIEITFLHSNTGKEETLKASLADTEWVMGQTNNYLISITPDYILDFTTEQVDMHMQDAHYVMVPLTIKAKFLNEGWKLSGTASDGSKVTFCESLTALQQSGYWIEEDRGQETLTSTTQGDEVNVYAFLEENVTNEKRTIDLSLRPASNVYQDRAAKTLQIEQLCPAWNGNLGCEHFEDGQYPWGFSWAKNDDNSKVTYTFTANGFWGAVGLAIIKWYIGRLNLDYITTTGRLVLQSATVDFSNIDAAGVADSDADGLTNTKELYNYEGVNEASDFMAQLESWGGVPDKDLNTNNPTEFAARACAMKNKYNKTTETTNGQTVDTPVLKEENFVWYLPAKNEIVQIVDSQYAMDGVYWTSTSEADGEEKAYIYTAGGNADQLDLRKTKHNVRAVRKKP